MPSITSSIFDVDALIEFAKSKFAFPMLLVTAAISFSKPSLPINFKTTSKDFNMDNDNCLKLLPISFTIVEMLATTLAIPLIILFIPSKNFIAILLPNSSKPPSFKFKLTKRSLNLFERSVKTGKNGAIILMANAEICFLTILKLSAIFSAFLITRLEIIKPN